MPRTLSGSVMDSSQRVLGRITRLVLIADRTDAPRFLRGLGEMTPPLKRCPDCHWLRIRQVGLLRIRVTSLDPAAPGKSLVHFRVLSVRPHGPARTARIKPTCGTAHRPRRP
jgi:hypothetical protein